MRVAAATKYRILGNSRQGHAERDEGIQAAAIGRPALRAFFKSRSILRRAFSTVPRRRSQSVASFMRLELPQAIPPRDLMNASRSKGPERTRRSTAALALQRLVVQEVLVVFRAICFEIINSISHRIAIVQIVVELFAEQPSVKSEHIPVGWLVKMGAVEPRNANTATFDLCHET